MEEKMSYAFMHTKVCKTCMKEKNEMLEFSPKSSSCRDCNNKERREKRAKMRIDKPYQWNKYPGRK